MNAWCVMAFMLSYSILSILLLYYSDISFLLELSSIYISEINKPSLFKKITLIFPQNHIFLLELAQPFQSCYKKQWVFPHLGEVMKVPFPPTIGLALWNGLLWEVC